MLALLLAHRGLAARPMHTSFHRPCPGVGSGDLLGPTETYPEILCQFSSVPSPFSYAVRNFRRKSSPYAFAILACRRRTAKHCLHYLLKRSSRPLPVCFRVSRVTRVTLRSLPFVFLCPCGTARSLLLRSDEPRKAWEHRRLGSSGKESPCHRTCWSRRCSDAPRRRSGRL